MTHDINTLVLLYRVRCKEIKKDPSWTYKQMDTYSNFNNLMSENEFKEVKRYLRNRTQKRYRANKKLQCLLRIHNDTGRAIIFGSLEPNDSQFFKGDKTPIKEITRRKKYNKYLDQYFLIYMSNIDYGTKNEREHYHNVGILKDGIELVPALNKNGIQAKSKKGIPLFKIKNDKEEYGFNTYEIAYTEDDDFNAKRLSNYLVKLNNHSNKLSTKNRRIVFKYDKEYFGIG